uniref:Zinc finger Ran-binding domain-containing protein 3 n=1 Tax=Aegilops tauschii TaxID=37682 RepID=M8BMY0_AEGTA
MSEMAAFIGLKGAVPFSTTQSQSGHISSVFKLVHYELVLQCLRKLTGVVVQDIPYRTRRAVQNAGTNCGSDKEVDELLMKLPRRLRDALLPFQLEGVKFGLRRQGRCLIADEMGLGKTLQKTNYQTKTTLPYLVVANYGKPLLFGSHLKQVQERVYASVRSTRQSGIFRFLSEGDNRPFDIYHQINMLCPRLLGDDKFEFAKTYCSLHVAQSSQGKIYQDFSKGARLTELNVLLSQTLMIRRLKEHLLNELPPKRRQIIRLKLKALNSRTATSIIQGDYNSTYSSSDAPIIASSEISNDCEEAKEGKDDSCKKSPRHFSPQEIGIAKIPGFSQWFSNHLMHDNLDAQSSCQKTLIFAHHLKVLDGVHVFLSEKEIKFVRIDGSALPRERKEAVDSFRLNPEVKVAIIGITAGGVGLDFSSAQNVVFLELPRSSSDLLQAEDRAHRRGQTNAVNIYIFCAKNTSDEPQWLRLNQSLFRVSSVVNGKKDAIREIEVDQVYHLGEISNTKERPEIEFLPNCNAGLLESGTMSVDHLPGISDMELESDFTIRTIPLQIEDEGLHSGMQCSPGPAVHEDTVCNSFSISPAISGSSSTRSKSMKARRSFCENRDTLGLPGTISDGHIRVEYLRFEVSHHTGRIHLYICVPGHDSRPRPLFQNFLPEEVESPLCSSSDKKASRQLLSNPAFCNMFKAFVKEWLELRPIDQRKLLGKPLQLPLSLELCYLTNSISHSTQGLIKGGSKRRIAPLSVVSDDLPENAEWRKVVLRRGTTKEREYTQGWTTDDEPLCKLCQKLCNGNLAKSPEYFEDLFCKLDCFRLYRLRTNQSALRQALFQIEHGICSQCKLDCCKLVKHIKPLSNPKREAHIRSVAPNIACRKKLLAKLVEEPTQGNAWHADHIVPVYKGGGECMLENMRTLCVACHAEVTKAQQKERKEARKEERRKAEELLRNAVNQLKDDVSSSSAVQACEATEDDDSWLVTVPGSAYSAVPQAPQSGHRQFQDVLRLNVDGSYIEGQNHAGCWGVVVRDNEGAVAAARAGRTDRVSSAFHAELLIACGAVDLALVWSGKNMPGAWRPSAICSCMYSAVYVWRILIGAHESTRDKVLKGSTRNTS